MDTSKMRHYEESDLIDAPAEKVFECVDDHKRLAGHMGESSWMMGGGRMGVKVDAGNGQKVGSHISMAGKVWGIDLFLDEVVTEYQPPNKKVWETVGPIRLVVIGHYRMGIAVADEDGESRLKVFIDYELPSGGTRWLGYLLGGMYAKWCVRQMLRGTVDYFADKKEGRVESE